MCLSRQGRGRYFRPAHLCSLAAKTHFVVQWHIFLASNLSARQKPCQPLSVCYPRTNEMLQKPDWTMSLCSHSHLLPPLPTLTQRHLPSHGQRWNMFLLQHVQWSSCTSAAQLTSPLPSASNLLLLLTCAHLSFHFLQSAEHYLHTVQDCKHNAKVKKKRCITKCSIFSPCQRINGNVLILIPVILLSNYKKKEMRSLQTLTTKRSNCRNKSVAHTTMFVILNYCSTWWVIQIHHHNMHVSNSVPGIPHSCLFWHATGMLLELRNYTKRFRWISSAVVKTLQKYIISIHLLDSLKNSLTFLPKAQCCHITSSSRFSL